ncbi:1-aminocyclopropane-1-carboxylate oxidase homolog 1-like [Vigna unguiculata]|uniref:1-aminocyclopropane-1-carboxylate oxidase homolog 1-like n=1 Tax=Vigna unguiculata TaxID=3917 RepID=UPI0010168408|nr:1-aminocyclopropane-1-carboxylate oxidase homolog 1-like [Vigna unguiculata]
MHEISKKDSRLTIPIIDLQDIKINSSLRAEVVDKIRSACQKWGFFQVINHGIGVEVLNEIIGEIRKIHEQDAEVRKTFYSRDSNKKVRYFSNVNPFRGKGANWRDTISFFLIPNPPNPKEIPISIVIEYSKKVRTLRDTIFELFSEALGLNPSYLKELESFNGQFILCHYYPACPEPELTLGTSKHTDSDFMTILLEDQMDGLQVLHENQ